MKSSDADLPDSLVPRTLTIDGARISDITSFYAEINRVLMVGEDWRLGETLDGFDDLLYGGYGALRGSEPVKLVWKDFSRMQVALGREVTQAYLAEKLKHPEQFDAALTRRKLKALEDGLGQTYCDIVLEIIASHPNIELVPA